MCHDMVHSVEHPPHTQPRPHGSTLELCVFPISVESIFWNVLTQNSYTTLYYRLKLSHAHPSPRRFPRSPTPRALVDQRFDLIAHPHHQTRVLRILSQSAKDGCLQRMRHAVPPRFGSLVLSFGSKGGEVERGVRGLTGLSRDHRPC